MVMMYLAWLACIIDLDVSAFGDRICHPSLGVQYPVESESLDCDQYIILGPSFVHLGLDLDCLNPIPDYVQLSRDTNSESHGLHIDERLGAYMILLGAQGTE